MVERAPDKRKRTRSLLRIERMMPLLEERLGSLEDARRVIEVLVSEAEKNRLHADLWQRLHDAAVRDDMLVELSHAYDQLLQGKRLVPLAPASQGFVLWHVAKFFHDVLGDTEKGL